MRFGVHGRPPPRCRRDRRQVRRRDHAEDPSSSAEAADALARRHRIRLVAGRDEYECTLFGLQKIPELFRDGFDVHNLRPPVVLDDRKDSVAHIGMPDVVPSASSREG